MSITVTIHCKSYVAHYLKSKFGNPVRIPPKTQTRKIFLACVQKEFEPQYHKRVKLLPEKVEVKLNEKDLRNHGHSIEPGNMFFVNGVFEEKIKNEMFHQVSRYHFKQNMKLRDAMLKYQQENGFTEEIFSLETIRCAYYALLDEK